ncbi:MAG: glycosyltransferase [Burkholderiaceae bacterium]
MENVKDLTFWADSFDPDSRPWLLLGKGPSFKQIAQVDCSGFFVCTLNHVIREQPADVAHIIDIDVVINCAQALEEHAGFLVMPYHPHENHKPSTKTLAQYASEIPVLDSLAKQGRLVGYNLSSTVRIHGESPVIDVKFFSAEAALNILATIGVRTVRSLGIDGGNQYAQSFTDLNDKTRLANGHANFDGQFRNIAKTILKTGIDYAPWYLNSPIKIFVGSDHAQVAGLKVLEYSIKKHASMSVEVQLIDDTGLPEPSAAENRSRTGFSFARFRIPQLCNYQGRGIYLDADMLVFTDIAELWTADMAGHSVLYSEQGAAGARVPQFSVMVLDCETLQWDVNQILSGLDANEYDYQQLMQKLCIVPPDKLGPLLPETWNSLEKYEAGKTHLIHYTDMPTQPWVSHSNRHGQIWYDHAREAIDCGFLTRDFLYEEVAKGHVSPELPSWLGLQKPADFSTLKSNWVPPYRRFVGMPSVPAYRSGGLPGLALRQRAAFAARALARRSPGFMIDLYRKARGRVRGY